MDTTSQPQAILGLIKRLLAEFDLRSIRYVHWKSNTNIAKALLGSDDLDILVHPQDRAATEATFESLGLLRALSPKDDWQRDIFHYVGTDMEACQLVHVHVHYALPVGYDYDKNFVLPVVEAYLATRWKQGLVYLPEVEMEYAILVLRLIIKNSLGPFLLELPHRQWRRLRMARNGVVSGGGMREFQDLAGRLDRRRLDEVLSQFFGFVGRPLFDLCEAVVLRNDSLREYFRAGAKLSRCLAFCATNSPAISFLKAGGRINLERAGKFVRRIYRRPGLGKKLATGGRILAFVGGDGAGKSTNVEALYTTLRRELATFHVHVGRPPKSLPGLAMKGVAKAIALAGAARYSRAFHLLGTALDRRAAFARAERLRSQGWLVVVDRVPLPGITRMDCPRIRLLGARGTHWMARWEERLHQRIRGVDQLFVLKLDPQIALRRRPEDDPAELMARSGEIWNDRWEAPYAAVLDTGANSPLQVRRIVLSQAWKVCSKPFLRIELVGLSGVGKSSISRELRKVIPNLAQSLPYWRFPLTSAAGALLGAPTAMRALLKVRDYQVAKNCLQLFAASALLARFRRTRFPATNYVLDQGPIFQYALAMKEGVLSAGGELIIQRACKEISALELHADRTEIFRRARLRSEHMGRIPLTDRMSFENFCDGYEAALRAASDAAGHRDQCRVEGEMGAVVSRILQVL